MYGSPSPHRVGQSANTIRRAPFGEFVELDGDVYYRIANYEQLVPFLMSVSSDSDLWMFVTSGGGLTAGRVNADGSLFPYETVDRLHDAHLHSGPVTTLLVTGEDGAELRWEPFAPPPAHEASHHRALYKNTTGNRVIFEETHRELGLRFRYAWSASDEFGWVRRASLENLTAKQIRLRMLDGLRNVLPFGVPLSLHQQSSNLVDAYKRSELDAETDLGIFSLTARITDGTEALEMLRANTVWCWGLTDRRTKLTREAWSAFREQRPLPMERVLNGARGNYLVEAQLSLQAGENTRWYLVADAGLDQTEIVELRRHLSGGEDLGSRIEASLHAATESLRRNVGSADGIQLSGHPEAWSHHFANVLFNNMRGGVFLRNYELPSADLRTFLRFRNREIALRHQRVLAELPETTTLQEILRVAARTEDPGFERLCHEYLPLHFSRRHGDPSRPWNRFSIRSRNQRGEGELSYEGNWRDIFQNWEALGHSFPGFLRSMVAKFVNASTVDGHNPYRITRDGVDWEIPSPDDPWGNIGYWGDHQIIYLLKLLEALDRFEPGAISQMLGRDIFSYADVPYKIRPYQDLVRDSRNTIDFDFALEERIDARVEQLGSDGKLLPGKNGSVLHVNLLEKLLVPLLAKLSNLVPGAGIWMNTQRPEWNDANNALAGGGVSVVTLCYLRRHLAFFCEHLDPSAATTHPISSEVAEWFSAVESKLRDALPLLDAEGLVAEDQKALLDGLAESFSAYRAQVYAEGLSTRTEFPVAKVVEFCRLALRFVDHGILANRRSDGLFHTYHQLVFSAGGESIELVHLQEMLEGQVAALSSGLLSAADALELLHALYDSALYQPKERSFLLYPSRELPSFLEKNRVPESEIAEIPLLRAMLQAEDARVISRDVEGTLRFAGDISGQHDLDQILDGLRDDERWTTMVENDRSATLALFDEVFGHRSYTGRSGVMYGYEGLGCIYWHMVAKLLLAVQENCLRAETEGASAELRDGLDKMYGRIRTGIGYEKSVSEYGAFPTDPYSHTPAAGGARQPGMTGQVKEEILTRFGELGLRIQQGCVCFRPSLLSAAELLEEATAFHHFDTDGCAQAIDLPPRSLAFTFCQVPVVYQATANDPSVAVSLSDGASVNLPGMELDAELSHELFSRSGRVRQVLVQVPEHLFRGP